MICAARKLEKFWFCKKWFCHQNCNFTSINNEQVVLFTNITAWEVPVFEVILVRIQSERGKIRTRITPNTDTFYAVYAFRIVKVLSALQDGGILILAVLFPIIQFLTIFSNKGHGLGLEL